jgi:hypothetical protein
MRYIIFFLSIAPLPCLCQIKDNQFRPNGNVPSKWINAIVNLECRKERYENLELQAQAHSLQENLQPIQQTSGTAIFFKDT